MTRVYYHYTDCEEFASDGMWRIVSGAAARERFVRAAAGLMITPSVFKEAMLRALVEWPNSCAMTMTSPSTNHQAWFGHAGCFLAVRSPEECTRLGWHTLNQAQQSAANLAADEVIAEWHRRAAEQPDQLSLSTWGVGWPD